MIHFKDDRLSISGDGQTLVREATVILAKLANAFYGGDEEKKAAFFAGICASAVQISAVMEEEERECETACTLN